MYMVEENHLLDKNDTKFKPGWKGGPGRPPKLKTQVKDFIKEHPYAVETLMTTLYEKGIEGDRESAMYIIDRIKGKPKATIGIAGEDKKLLTLATILEFRKLIDSERLQLKEGEYAVSGQGDQEEARQGLHSGEEGDDK